MSKVISSFMLMFSICQLSIGIWEAVYATNNAPNKHPNLNVQNQEIYGFTIARACCNILTGISLFITGVFMFCTEPTS